MAVGWGMYSWVGGGVGWDKNVTGSLTHTSCYATVRSLGLPHIRHANVMLRYCTKRFLEELEVLL